MRHWLTALGLAAMLMLAQVALAAHGLEHAFGDAVPEHPEACVVCVALGGLAGGVLPAAGPPPPVEAPAAVAPVPAPSLVAADPAPAAYLARAPPALS